MLKKKEELSLEDRLKNALVPIEEQPYQLPENWVWTRIELIIKLISGRDVPASQCNDLQAGIPYILGASNIENNTFIVERWIEKPVVVSIKGDILLSVKGTIGKVYEQVEPEINISRQIMALRAGSALHKNLLKMFLIHISDHLKETGNGLIPGISRENILKREFPLPPLNEQGRIVALVESLFAKLDKAKELAQSALDSFETRKAAILHKAFTGELTAKWREEHDVSWASWEKRKLGELGTLERGKSKHRPRNDERLFGGRYPFIQTGDVANADVYITEHKQTLSEFGLLQSKIFPSGTLCITIAANIGDVAILSYDCCFPDSVVGFTPNKYSISKYIYYTMFTLKDEINTNAPATAQKNINLKILNEVLIKIPGIAEQTEIVRILDSLFQKEQKAKELVDVIKKVDLMKKALLVCAFRGKLGTNDPNEECSVELLKKTILDKMNSVPIKVVKEIRMEVPTVALTIKEALNKHKKLTPEQLKKETELDIDDFYDEIKKLVNDGTIMETRESDTVYLEAVSNAN